MPASKAQQRATNKWISKAYDRINLTMPKGKKKVIQDYAAAVVESVNGYINAAIDGRMAQEAARAPTEARGIIISPLATVKAAQEAASAAGEAVSAFVSRAVETRTKRDKLARRMGV